MNDLVGFSSIFHELFIMNHLYLFIMNDLVGFSSIV